MGLLILSGIALVKFGVEIDARANVHRNCLEHDVYARFRGEGLRIIVEDNGSRPGGGSRRPENKNDAVHIDKKVVGWIESKLMRLVKSRGPWGRGVKTHSLRPLPSAAPFNPEHMEIFN